MKILIINSCCGLRSTGRICVELAEAFEEGHNSVKIAYGRLSVPNKYKKYAIRIGNSLTKYISAFKSRILDNDGFNCKSETKKFLKWANDFNPDVLWLHNLHDHYINVELLFNWIKTRPNMEVKWTLHDCWSFTGHCSYFDYVKCDKWKNHCKKCPQKHSAPKSLLFDNSYNNFSKK